MKFLVLAFMSPLAMLVAGIPNPALNTTEDSQAIQANPWYIGTECKNSKVGNIYGTCQYTSTCKARSGTADSNPDCPGPDDVQCCVFDDCVNGAKGTCVDTRNWRCRGNGGFNSGNHCPGPDTYLCCQGDICRSGGQCPI